MIRLIVTADDLGNGPCRDRGIFRAFSAGIVTGAALLANGPTFAAAVREARHLKLPVGVHLNLSEGPALSGAIDGLTDAAGHFPGKQETRRRLADGHVNGKALQRELLAQVERVVDAGLQPDHLDTHQHLFLYPPVTTAVVETARVTGIVALRRPVPAEPVADDPDGRLGAELKLYRRLAQKVAMNMNAENFFYPDGLWGMPLLNRLTEERLLDLLRRLPPGTWELMTHPGHASPTEPFSGPEREAELRALTAPAVAKLLARRRIELTTFGAMSCAS